MVNFNNTMVKGSNDAQSQISSLTELNEVITATDKTTGKFVKSQKDRAAAQKEASTIAEGLKDIDINSIEGLKKYTEETNKYIKSLERRNCLK